MTQTIKSALDGKAKKLKQLGDLLSDPDIETIARKLLFQSDASAPAPKFSHRILTVRLRNSRGALARAVMQVVNTSEKQVTAKQVAEAMEANGFVFNAADKYIAVSKVLRKMAKSGKVVPQKTGRGKAAILYRKPDQNFPVRGTMQ